MIRSEAVNACAHSKTAASSKTREIEDVTRRGETTTTVAHARYTSGRVQSLSLHHCCVQLEHALRCRRLLPTLLAASRSLLPCSPVAVELRPHHNNTTTDPRSPLSPPIHHAPTASHPAMRIAARPGIH
jgi:hypothetical protein